MTRAALLKRASECYARTGRQWLADAARTASAAGDNIHAARLYESCGLRSEAGTLFRIEGLWEDAARCFEAAGDFAAAADCATQAGRIADAIWYLAQAGASPAAVEDAAASLDRADAFMAVNLEIALSMSQASIAAKLAAAHLRGSIPLLGQIGDLHLRRVAEARLVHGADFIRRPDLAAEAFASALTAGDQDAAERWRIWAKARGARQPDPPKIEDTK